MTHDAATQRDVDIVVIGAGPAGEVAAEYAVSGRDASAVLVEAELLGGECSYWACIPSKALLRPIDVVATATHLQGVTGARLDREALLARRDAWVHAYDDASQMDWAHGAGLEVVRGRGRLAGERTVVVDGPDGSRSTLRAREAVILATGSVAVVPHPYAAALPWTSRDSTGVVEIPESIAIIGGGVVACESARWLAALGSAVTMVVRGSRLLDREESFAGEAVAAGLRAEGVDVRLGADVRTLTREDPRDTGIGRIHGGPVRLDLGDEVLEVAEVLVATGRRPAVDGLGLESVGLRAEDLRGRTHDGPLPPWLYAVGDVNAVAPLTHWGKDQARRVGRLIAARATGAPTTDLAEGPVPQVIFTEPQVASVGLRSDEAAQAGVPVRLLDADYASVAGAALLRDDVAGHARLVVRAADDVLLGATFVGPEVAEIVHAATVAVAGGLTLATLRTAVASYPTASEIWLKLLEH